MVGSYAVSSCNFAEGANHSWSWSSSDPTSPDHYEKHENCPDRIGGNGGRTDQEGGLSTTDALGRSNGASPGTSAGWSFKAPTGTTIGGITYERYIGHVFDASNYWAPALRADSTIVPGESCLDTSQNQWSCYVGGPPNEGGETKTITGLSAHELTLGIACLAHTEEQCITGASQHSAWAAMYGATVTINDPTPPTLATPTGPLWEPSTYKKGNQAVTLDAEDIGGGVKTIQLTVDGHPTRTYNATCDYTYRQPCPTNTGPQTLSLPTTELADGTHTVAITATDAAGNQSNALSEQIDVENNPPPAPLSLTATTPPPGNYTFAASWTDPPNLRTPIIGATYELCSTEGAGCQPPIDLPDTETTAITVPGPGVWTVSLWLTNAAGNASPSHAAVIGLHAQAASPLSSTGDGVGTPLIPVATPPSHTGQPPSPTPRALRVVTRIQHSFLRVLVIGPSGRAHLVLDAHEDGRVNLLAAVSVRVRAGYTRLVRLHLPRMNRRTRLILTTTLGSQHNSRAISAPSGSA